MEIATGKIFLFQPNAEVELIVDWNFIKNWLKRLLSDVEAQPNVEVELIKDWNVIKNCAKSMPAEVKTKLNSID